MKNYNDKNALQCIVEFIKHSQKYKYRVNMSNQTISANLKKDAEKIETVIGDFVDNSLLCSVMTSEGDILSASNAFYDLLGFSIEDADLVNVKDIFINDSAELFQNVIKSFIDCRVINSIFDTYVYIKISGKITGYYKAILNIIERNNEYYVLSLFFDYTAYNYEN